MRSVPDPTRLPRLERRADPQRREQVELALWLAEWNAQWGDYGRGLEHLASADELSGGATTRRFARKRRAWQRAMGP